MGIHYDYKSKRGERAMLKEAKRKARLAQKRAKKLLSSESDIEIKVVVDTHNHRGSLKGSRKCSLKGSRKGSRKSRKDRKSRRTNLAGGRRRKGSRKSRKGRKGARKH